MIALSSEPWLIWAGVALVAIALAGWALSIRAQASRTKSRLAHRHMLNRLHAANDTLAAVVADERAVVAAIGALPSDVPPAVAERMLRDLTPDYSFHDRYLLMVHGWERGQIPQALSALAGMALADASGAHGELESALRRAIEEGSPVLVDQVAAELAARQTELERWLKTGGQLLQLERAAKRVKTTEPAIAARIEDAIERIKPRMGELMMTTLRGHIARWQDNAEPGEAPPAPEKAAETLVPYCLPRFPELVAAVHAALSEHQGPDWEQARLRFDWALIYHFHDRGGLAGFDQKAAIDRLCEGIMAWDETVSFSAAHYAAMLLSDYFLDTPEFRLSLQNALDWAEHIHGTGSAYEWLTRELRPFADEAERLTEAQANFERRQAINDAVKRLSETTATLEPEIALVELRHLLPDTPADILRVSLIARWKDDHAVVCLAALAGLALELAEAPAPREGLMGLCLHWPLRHGPAALIASLLAAITARFVTFDPWIVDESAVRDLRQTAIRIEPDAPETAAALLGLAQRVQQRRVVLLEAMIGARLMRAEAEPTQTDPFELVLDLYRMYLPGETRLTLPVRAFFEARTATAGWRRAQLYLESMSLKYFGALNEAAGYDFEYLQDLLGEGLKDMDVEAAWLAAMLAADLINKDLLTRQDDFDALEFDLKWADNLFDPLPDSFATLRAAIIRAMQRQKAEVPH